MRKIIKIEESKCDGCGLCAQACHEGAIVMENNKAKLVSDSYCDGLGDCIGECPRGAISFEMREAALYDEAAVKARMATRKTNVAHDAPLPCGCPGSMARELKKREAQKSADAQQACACSVPASELRNWPVQIKLVPTEAPYLGGAHLLIAADCTAFAYPNFHARLLPGKVCLVGCPKLDDMEQYIEKLSQIIRRNGISKIDVAYMEVPCCGGLVRLVEDAIARSGAAVTLKLIKLSLDGKRLEAKANFA